MTIAQFKKQLESVNHSKEKRLENTRFVQEFPNLIPLLFDIALQEKEPVAKKAMWLLEFVGREELSLLFPYLDAFINTMKQVQLDPSIRPAAKICEYLIENYFGKGNYPEVKNHLSAKHKEQIIEQCFDWIIDAKCKVAAKAYSMTTLYLLGTESDWIHPELQIILEQGYHEGSAAYKARARQVLEKIKRK